MEQFTKQRESRPHPGRAEGTRPASPTIGYTLEQYAALKDAIAGGELVVQYRDRRVQYRSLDEMQRVLGLMEAELFPAPACRRRHRAIFDKGL